MKFSQKQISQILFNQAHGKPGTEGPADPVCEACANLEADLPDTYTEGMELCGDCQAYFQLAETEDSGEQLIMDVIQRIMEIINLKGEDATDGECLDMIAEVLTSNGWDIEAEIP